MLYLLMSTLINEYQPFLNLNGSQQVIDKLRMIRTNYFPGSFDKLMDSAHK